MIECVIYKGVMIHLAHETRRDETQYWVHKNEMRRDFKKTTMTKYMNGPTDFYSASHSVAHAF